MTADDLILEQITLDRVEDVWPYAIGFLSRACRRGVSAIEPDEILRRVLARQNSLWAIYERTHPLPLLAAAVTHVRGSVVTISHIGGRNMSRWLRPALAEFERLARDHGMNEIEIEGRFGWQRLLADYQPKRIAMRKTL